MRHTRRVVLAVVAVLPLALAGCGSGDPPSAAGPSTAPAGPSAATPPQPPPTTPGPDEEPRQQALDAYVSMQRAYQRAAETADPDHPDLARYAAGDALRRLRDGLTSIRDQGLRGRGEATYRPVVESVNPIDAPTTITVRDCMDTSATELYDPSGAPYQDEPGGLRLVVATVEVVDGTWKVTSFGVHEVGTCVRAG
jgi:hypothetical protein